MLDPVGAPVGPALDPVRPLVAAALDPVRAPVAALFYLTRHLLGAAVDLAGLPRVALACGLDCCPVTTPLDPLGALLGAPVDPLRASLSPAIDALGTLLSALLDTLGTALEGVVVALLRLARRSSGGEGGDGDRSGKRRKTTVPQELSK